MKNVHPVYGAGIQTHNLQNMRPLSLPLDQGGPAQFSQSYPSSIRVFKITCEKRWEEQVRMNLERVNPYRQIVILPLFK